jgi:hypothetical protein
MASTVGDDFSFSLLFRFERDACDVREVASAGTSFSSTFPRLLRLLLVVDVDVARGGGPAPSRESGRANSGDLEVLPDELVLVRLPERPERRVGSRESTGGPIVVVVVISSDDGKVGDGKGGAKAQSSRSGSGLPDSHV